MDDLSAQSGQPVSYTHLGQTPGKRLAQIRITNREGKPASPAQLGTRALSFLFLEQTFNNAAFLVRTLLTRFLNPGLVQGYYVFGLAASLVSVLLLLKTKRCMLHDKLAGTQVSACLLYTSRFV